MPAVPVVNSDFVPRGIDQALGKRMTARALGADGNAGQRYFESIGYETRRYGPNWDWSYRKPGENAYRPVNPRGLDAGDVASFIADILIGAGSAAAAILTGTATSLTGPGALVAGAAAGGATAGALEAARQGLGGMAGIPDNVSGGNVAAAAAGGVIGEVGGAAIGAGVRAVGRGMGKAVRGGAFLSREAFGRFGGLKSVGALTPGDVLIEGGLKTQGGRMPMMSSEAAGALFARTIRWIDHHGMKKEAALVEKKLVDAAQNGVQTNILPAIDEISQYTLSPSLISQRAAEKIGITKNLPNEAAELLDALRIGTGYKGRWDKAPVDVAAKVKRILQQRAAKKGAFEGVGPSSEITSIATKSGHIVRDRLEKSMGLTDPEYVPLMRQFDMRLKWLDDYKEALAVADSGPAAEARRTRYVQGIFGKGNTQWLEGIHTLQQQFPAGTPSIRLAAVSKAVREAGIGESIGKQGIGEALRGSALLSGAAVPIVGTVLVGAPGLIAGTALTSPKLLIKGVPTAVGLSNAARNATSALARVHLGGTTRVAAVGVLDATAIQTLRENVSREGGGTKGISRQDGIPRRRILIGR